MNYKQTIDYLFKKLPSYQNIGKSAYKKDIGNIKIASEKLGNPHLNFKSVHVAGTNGKGSVSHMIASIMQEAGYKVGLYTSPHLKDFRERIKINGKKISKREVIEFIADNKKKFEDLELSFFEMTVALSFYYFNKINVDIAIIETGLGGRLDSTNIISPEISIITNISLDHTNLLGNSIQKIAQDKDKKDKTHNQNYNTQLYKLSSERFKYKKELQNIDDKINQIIHLKKLNREKCDKCKKQGFFPIKCGCPSNHKFCEDCYDNIIENNNDCPLCECNIVCEICPICYKVKNNRLIEWCENKHKFCIGCYHILSQKNIESCPYCRSSRI